MSISSVQDIVADLKAGRMLTLDDEEDRENEGDLVIAAQHCTAEAINTSGNEIQVEGGLYIKNLNQGIPLKQRVI